MAQANECSISLVIMMFRYKENKEVPEVRAHISGINKTQNNDLFCPDIFCTEVDRMRHRHIGDTFQETLVI